MSSKEIITILNRLDVPVANHMSVMDDQMVTKVEQFFSDVKKRAAQRRATEVERELKEKQRQRERAARQLEMQRNTEARQGEQRPERTGAAAGHDNRQGTRTESSTNVRTEYGRMGTRPQQEVATTGAQPAQSTRGQVQQSGEQPSDNAMRAQTRTAALRNDSQTEERVFPGPNNNQGQDNNASRGGDRGGAPNRPRSDRPHGGYSNNGDRPRSNDRPQGADRPRGDRPYGSGQQGTGDRRSSNSGSDNRGGGQRFGQDRPSGGGGNRPGGDRNDRRGSYGGGGRPGGGGQQSGGYSSDRRGPAGGGGRPGGGFGGRSDSRGPRPGGAGAGSGRPGGNRGGQTGGSVLAIQSKPSAANAPRKDKDKTRGNDFNRDRKERFNEDKLRPGSRRRPGGGNRTEVKRPEYPTKVTVEGPMTVGDFAKALRREASEIIKKLLFLGIMATINQDIETEAMELIAGEYGVELTILEPVDEEAVDMLIEEEDPSLQMSRPPVVTIMGHVDHGKTTLLDAIRSSKVTATEAGGITQHIGAYQVEAGGRLITFLDTPGHEAFTTMRARGAQVTDVTILVVAADDGVMPQTIEAINHAKAANVPIIVAVNKIDKPDANPDRVKQELTQYGLVSEEWGGDTVFVEVSALRQQNLESLLEMVLLVADMQEVKANPEGRPRGTVIEAKLDKGRGPVATVLVQNGTLKVGDIVVAGTTFGRVRAMVNDLGKRLKSAGPSTPVEIQGLGDVPSAGDLFVVYDDERPARNLVQKRLNRERAEQMQQTSRVTLDDLYRQIKEGNVKELNVIVKADVQGSVEALVQSIEKIEVEGVRVKVIHKGAGAITESDVALASASNAIIIGFSVRPDVNAKRAAEAEKVDIRLYRVIYNVIEELQSAMKGMLDPEYKEVTLGHAEVRDVFHISKIGTVAGCYVTEGKITRDAEARVIRDGVVIYEGSLESLKRFKDDVREVATGFECGVTLERFQDLKVGDVIEAFKMEAVKPN
uniref:translation initiation factor IF-2 n=1 Tax=Alicyclobacillus tolerans TaxID=90970 RepID=UPI0023510FEC|nr:translation initiation factor IF-2 [Alicyclobacillus tolerans]